MNKGDKSWLCRIETKIDSISERSIRTETMLKDHLLQHQKRIKYGLALLGFVGTVFATSVSWIIKKIGGK